METLDITIVCAYFILCMAVGLYGVGKVRNIREYAIGNGTFTAGMVSATLFATHLGAESTVGVVEEVASVGILFGFGLLAQPLMWLFMSWIFVPRIEKFKKAGCISFGDIMEQLYGKGPRILADICTLLVSVTTVSTQLVAIGYLFQTFFGVSLFEGAIIGFGIVVLYSFVGGIRAVVFTDVFQAVVLLVALPIICMTVFYDVGGIDSVLANVPVANFHIDFTKQSVVTLISVFVWMTFASAAVFIQRFLMASDKEQLQTALKRLFILYFPFGLLLLFMGFIIRARIEITSENIGVYSMMQQYVPSGLKGVVVAGLMAVVMSTADSFLHTASVVCAREAGRTLKMDELKAARISLIVLSIIAVMVTFYGPKNLVLIDMIACNLWSPMMYAPIASGFLGFSLSVTSFWVGVAFGIVGALLSAYANARIMGIPDMINFSGVSEIVGSIFCGAAMVAVYIVEKRKTFSIMPLIQKWREKLIECYSVYIYPSLSFDAVRKAFEYKEDDRWKYHFLGVFGFTYFMLSSFAFMDFTDVSKSTITILRIGSLSACFMLLVHDVYLTRKMQQYIMPAMWYLSLIYCLPFLSSYTVMVTDYDTLWMINFMVSVTMFYTLANGRAPLLGLVVGVMSARVVFAMTGYNIIPEAASYGPGLLFIYVLSTISVVYVLYQSQIKAMLLYGQSIAHELLQPLAGTHMIAETMIKSYKDGEASEPEEIERLTEWATLILAASKSGIRSVRMILSAFREDIEMASDKGTYSILECVTEVVQEYGLMLEDHKRIKILGDEIRSFSFYGSKYFIKQVINNLLHNAFKYAGRKATINIWWEDGILHIKDDGVGIPKHVLPHLFKRFQNIEGSLSGSGVGLAFAKKVMESFGGSIRCESEEGKYTLFTLSFPPVDSKS